LTFAVLFNGLTPSGNSRARGWPSVPSAYAAAAAAPVPGTIQAEDFDDGANGVAYRDNSAGNSGGQYRATDVDIEFTSDSGGGYDVGWVSAGEWLNYTVNVGAAGTYDIAFRVASTGSGGTFHLEVNGVNKTGSVSVPNTGSWQTWRSVTKTGVALAAGQQVWRLVMDTNGSTAVVGNFNYLRASAAAGSSTTPFGGTPTALPGTLQAENFDDGNAGQAYVDNTSANSGGQYRNTAVDIGSASDSGGGYYVGWTSPGEWLKYTVNVATAGSYDVDLRVASGGAGGTLHLEVNGTDVTGPLPIPNTGAWQTWTTIRKPGVSLPAGVQSWRLVMDSNGATGAVGNINYIRVGAPAGSPYGGTRVSVPGTIQAENFDEGGPGIAYVDASGGNSGGRYRSTDVDIEATTDSGGGYDVGWTSPGEWLNYSVSVAAAGTYDLDVRVASAGAGGKFHIEVNGIDKTGPLTVPNTGGWQTWTTIKKTGVALSAGSQTVRLVMDTNGSTGAVGNFNWIRVAAPSALGILRGPYLQQVTDINAIVVWTTRSPGTGQIRYAPSGGSTTSVTAQAQTFPGSQTGLPYDFTQYEARLTGLSAATKYTYDVFMNGVDGTSGQDAFTTAPRAGTGTVRFIAFGDSGTGSSAQTQLAARMASDTFDLALHTGDVAYGNANLVGGASYTQYDNWLFGVYSWMRSRPLYPSIGNHDDEIGFARAYRDVFALPEEGATSTYPDNAERFYSFDYGPVHFVALDTEHAFIDTGRRQAQLAWLDADLAATTQPWRVVYFHRPPYSSGSEHGSSLDVRQAFAPIFERRGVNLVLSGHDHDYERSKPWRQYVTTGSLVTYVVTGGGGAALYPVGTSAWTAAAASTNHYTRVTAGTGCVMTIEAVRTDGVVFDKASIDRCAGTATTQVNQAPVVSLSSPTNGASYSAPASVTLTASATDDKAVTRVEFYSGTTLLNTDTAAPYSFNWTGVSTGTYSVRATAYDGDGASATTAAATITVGAAVSAPTGVVFQKSPDHATLVTSYELRIFANGVNSNTATPLAKVNLGKPVPATNGDITVSLATFFSSLAVGTYVAAVAAIGSGGASVSTGVTFTR
jgi:carbohydrate binding protein with CBM6 domain/Big-like domain-containing protein/calcineurin-like phosphoesterase family protein/purple acid phosphatase-like protein